MTSVSYYAIFPFCDGGKKKDDKKTKAFYDWATTSIPVKKTTKKTKAFCDWATTGIAVITVAKETTLTTIPLRERESKLFVYS